MKNERAIQFLPGENVGQPSKLWFQFSRHIWVCVWISESGWCLYASIRIKSFSAGLLSSLSLSEELGQCNLDNHTAAHSCWWRARAPSAAGWKSERLKRAQVLSSTAFWGQEPTGQETAATGNHKRLLNYFKYPRSLHLSFSCFLLRCCFGGFFWGKKRGSELMLINMFSRIWRTELNHHYIHDARSHTFTG